MRLRIPDNATLQLVGIFKAVHLRRCFYCGVRVHRVQHVDGKPPLPNMLTLDHMIPIGRGGAKGNNKRGQLNTVTACYACNYAKGSMTIGEYRASIDEIWGERAARVIKEDAERQAAKYPTAKFRIIA